MCLSEPIPVYDEGLWSASDAMASEYEAGDFLYGLTRLLKPVIILETGCYEGHTTLRIAEAVISNGIGVFLTCDTDAARMSVAMKRVPSMGVWFKHCTGEQLCKDTANVDLAFLDSGGDRVAEAKALRLSTRGIVVLHDARRETYHQILEELHWQSIFVDSPRGLAILQPLKNF